MDRVNMLLRLYEKSFELIPFIEFDNTDISLFSNNNLNIILRYYPDTLDKEKIGDEAKYFRQKMHKHKFNAWNTYLIIFTDKEINYDDLFVIERDSKSMRRYVIRNERDFNRVPFLDNIDVVPNPFKITSQTKMGNDPLMIKINKFIELNGGENKKIDSDIIAMNLKSIFNLEG